MDLAPPIGQRVSVEGVGRRVVMGQCVVMRGWQRGPQRGLAVMVWRTCEKAEGERAINICGFQCLAPCKPVQCGLEPRL